MTPLHEKITARLTCMESAVAIEPADAGRDPITYASLARIVAAVQNRIPRDIETVGILSSQTPEAYAAAISAFLHGVPFVPLNPKFPLDRLRSIASLAGLGLVLHDERTAALARDLGCTMVDVSPIVVACDQEAGPGVSFRPAGTAPGPVAVAYQMFTSGSTGIPKGVPVTSTSLSAYVEGIGRLAPVRAGERHSQTFDLSFDLSMHDIFVTLASGATIVQPSEIDLLMPERYIQKRKLDVWFSVPFLAHLAAGSIRDTGRLSHRMRLAMFCGESLPADYARRFQVFMADNSETYNLYGPTEATIAFTAIRFSAAEHTSPNVPIGWPFGSNVVAILDDAGRVREAAPGVEGELLLAGPQVFAGYSPTVADPFLVSGGTRYYRSGDRVTCGESGLYHLCRTDQQLKLRGYRIEAAEVESACRAALGVDQAVALVVGEGPRARLVVAYVSSRPEDALDETTLGRQLPQYMIPSEFRRFDSLPLNANSKVDRRKLAQLWS